MIYNFDTKDNVTATAALIVYAVYRSRDKKRFKVTPDVWGQIDRFVKASAKRATNLPIFIDSLMPKLCCASISPKWMDVGINGRLTQYGNEFIEFAGKKREFLTYVLSDVNHDDVIKMLYRETMWVILVVRDRLEREKPIEHTFTQDEDMKDE
ncbi:MAG: hypothetical protein U5M23_01465 [Marinagarivorans sp.]|nr:hypothetical protein [Marinagarivorans sp.]